MSEKSVDREWPKGKGMARLRINVDATLGEDALREGLASLASHDEGMRLIKTLVGLVTTGDLSLCLSGRITKKLKAFAIKQQGRGSTEEIDDELFLSWLQQEGSVEPHLEWEIECLRNSEGIYRIVLEGSEA